MKFEKFLKKAAKQVETNGRHLANNVKVNLVKNIDLADDRRRAREAKEKFEKNDELNQAVANGGAFDKTIEEATLLIKKANEEYSAVVLNVSNLNFKNEITIELENNKKSAYGCISASESTLNDIKKTKEEMLTSIKLAKEKYHFIQQAPEQAVENDRIIEEAKKAAEEVLLASNKVIKLYEEAKLTEKLSTLKDFLQKVLSIRLQSIQANFEKLQGQMRIEAEKAAAEKAEAERGTIERMVAEKNVAKIKTEMGSTAVKWDGTDFLKQFDEMQRRQKWEMDEFFKKVQVSNNEVGSIVTPAPSSTK